MIESDFGFRRCRDAAGHPSGKTQWTCSVRESPRRPVEFGIGIVGQNLTGIRFGCFVYRQIDQPERAVDDFPSAHPDDGHADVVQILARLGQLRAADHRVADFVRVAADHDIIKEMTAISTILGGRRTVHMLSTDVSTMRSL